MQQFEKFRKIGMRLFFLLRILRRKRI